MQDVHEIVPRKSDGYERRGRKMNADALKKIRNHGSADHDVIHHQKTNLPASQVIVDLENHTNST